MESKKHGGKRANAGRKSQYKEETQTISFRVPKSLIEPIAKYVKRALAKSKNLIEHNVWCFAKAGLLTTKIN